MNALVANDAGAHSRDLQIGLLNAKHLHVPWPVIVGGKEWFDHDYPTRLDMSSQTGNRLFKFVRVASIGNRAEETNHNIVVAAQVKRSKVL